MNCANHPEREKVAFCQNCGKPLCQECTRTVGSAVFCEPCLIAKLAGAGTPASPGGAYTSTPAGGSYPYTGTPGDVNYTVTGAVPPPRVPGEPNPGLAALLGFIPGVGAMYNGQYAKGVVHLIVFAILVSLADQNGIFGLFITGWVFYQIIEAYQTARARRDGTPLPNPFGLNDLGERLGFGKAWPSASHPNPAAPASAPPPTTEYVPPYVPPASAAWSAPWTPSSGNPAPGSTPWDNDTYANYAVPPVPPIPPYGTSAPLVDPVTSSVTSRFPSGALWLIGLGCIFLVSNAGLFHHFPIHRLVPFLLIGFGVWLFVHKMTEGGSLADDGSSGYRYRLFCALRGSIWVTVVGVLFLLDSFDILSWGHSWPLLLVAAGVMAIVRRVSYPPPLYPYAAGAYAAPPVPPSAPPVPGTSIVPSSRHDQEGS
jgi:hypothetical protein